MAIYCPDITVENGEVVENSCVRGEACPFSHTVEEMVFHPHFYKTRTCPDWRTPLGCQRYYCHFAHGPTEKRKAPLTTSSCPCVLPEIEPSLLIDVVRSLAAEGNKLEPLVPGAHASAPHAIKSPGASPMAASAVPTVPAIVVTRVGGGTTHMAAGLDGIPPPPPPPPDHGARLNLGLGASVGGHDGEGRKALPALGYSGTASSAQAVPVSGPPSTTAPGSSIGSPPEFMTRNVNSTQQTPPFPPGDAQPQQPPQVKRADTFHTTTTTVLRRNASTRTPSLQSDQDHPQAQAMSGGDQRKQVLSWCPPPSHPPPPPTAAPGSSNDGLMMKVMSAAMQAAQAALHEHQQANNGSGVPLENLQPFFQQMHNQMAQQTQHQQPSAVPPPPPSRGFTRSGTAPLPPVGPPPSRLPGEGLQKGKPGLRSLASTSSVGFGPGGSPRGRSGSIW